MPLEQPSGTQPDPGRDSLAEPWLGPGTFRSHLKRPVGRLDGSTRKDQGAKLFVIASGFFDRSVRYCC